MTKLTNEEINQFKINHDQSENDVFGDDIFEYEIEEKVSAVPEGFQMGDDISNSNAFDSMASSVGGNENIGRNAFDSMASSVGGNGNIGRNAFDSVAPSVGGSENLGEKSEAFDSDGFYVTGLFDEGEGSNGFDARNTQFENSDLDSTSLNDADSNSVRSKFSRLPHNLIKKHPKLFAILSAATIAVIAFAIIFSIKSLNKSNMNFLSANLGEKKQAELSLAYTTKETTTTVGQNSLVEMETENPAEHVWEDVNPVNTVNTVDGVGDYANVPFIEPGKGIYFGIDVSTYQGNIDWNQVAASGVKFAFIRVGYRGWGTGKIVPDDRAIQNLQGAAAAGINVGVYFYSTATNYQEGMEEANWVTQFIKNFNVNYPVVCDYEDFVSAGHRSYGIGNGAMTQAIMGFLDGVSAKGYQAMLYASKSYLTSKFDTQSFVNKGYKIWVAHYPSPAYPETPKTSYNRTSYNFWQYTSKGSVPGIYGNVDLDLAYFGATPDELLNPTTTEKPTTTKATTETTKETTTAETTAEETTTVDDLQAGAGGAEGGDI